MNNSYQRLLVIDDERSSCDFVSEVAVDCGFEVAAATTHADFKRLYRSFRPTFIVMDLAMPDGDGIELLRFLSAENNKAAIVLMSGFDKKVLSTAGRLGKEQGLNIAGTLEKPFAIEDLEAMITATPDLSEVTLTDELADGLDSDELTVHYQPKVNLIEAPDHPVGGVEALVRWQHPKRGLLSPDAFLGIAERANLLLPLTLAVVMQAFAQASAWRARGLNMSVALNIAPQLLTNLNLPDEIAALAQDHDIPTQQVMLEITETGLMENTRLAMEILTRFRLKGFQLSLDDFGTGASSLAHLYRMPFSELKIDQSFVRDVCTSDEASVIVRTTVEMAHNLNLSVCAEGVEDRETLEFLIRCGCDKAQGYLISRPVPGDALFEFGPVWNSVAVQDDGFEFEPVWPNAPEHPDIPASETVPAKELQIREVPAASPRVVLPDPVYRYCPLWEVGTNQVFCYLCEPRWPVGDGESQPEESLQEILGDPRRVMIVDVETLHKAVDQVESVVDRLAFMNVLIPVHFQTLASSERAEQYLEVCNSRIWPVHDYVYFEIVHPPASVVREDLARVAQTIAPFGSGVMLRLPSGFDRLDQIPTEDLLSVGMNLPPEPRPNSEILAELRVFAAETDVLGISRHVHGLQSTSLAMGAAYAGLEFVGTGSVASLEAWEPESGDAPFDLFESTAALKKAGSDAYSTS